MPAWILYALGSAAFAALVAIFGKAGLSSIDSTLATTLRSIVMATFLVVVSLVIGKFELLHTVARKDAMYIVLAGLAGALSWLFYFVALKTGPASGVAALDRLSVVFVLVIAIAVLGEHLTWRTGIGAVLITLGAVLMSWR